jgi:hypothetical protein
MLLLKVAPALAHRRNESQKYPWVPSRSCESAYHFGGGLVTIRRMGSAQAVKIVPDWALTNGAAG